MDRNNVILVVEDHTGEREALIRLLQNEGYEARGAQDASEALTFLQQPVDLVISDVRLGVSSGIELLQKWKRLRRSTPFFLVTAYAEVSAAVRALKLGADEYFEKPIDPPELLAMVAAMLRKSQSLEGPAKRKNQLTKTLGFEKIVGASDVMQELCEKLRRTSQVDSTVLLTGESGSGKELFAEAIHYNSPRREGPFVTVNMAAVPATLVESELFGHAKGSFTGANESRIGKYEAANGGTLFIDEIGDFAASSQAKLLRVLENQRVTPVGSNEEREVDVRVVAATSRDLQAMATSGDFRTDLYFRLDVIHLHIPPLRQRRECIPLLVDHFLDELSDLLERPAPTLEPQLLDYLVNHDWPGNVRQLKNCLESMFVLADEAVLRLNDLPLSARFQPGRRQPTVPPNMPLDELERAAIENALREYDGNRTYAAKALKISVRTLQRKLKEFGQDAGGSR